MTDEEKAFCKSVRDYFGLRVASEGTKPVRIRAYPRTENWQGWYAQGKTRVQAYRQLVRVMVSIPAYRGERDAEKIIRALQTEAKQAARNDTVGVAL